MLDEWMMYGRVLDDFLLNDCVLNGWVLDDSVLGDEREDRVSDDVHFVVLHNPHCLSCKIGIKRLIFQKEETQANSFTR